jgi:hypothetical protein
MAQHPIEAKRELKQRIARAGTSKKPMNTRFLANSPYHKIVKDKWREYYTLSRICDDW